MKLKINWLAVVGLLSADALIILILRALGAEEEFWISTALFFVVALFYPYPLVIQEEDE